MKHNRTKRRQNISETIEFHRDAQPAQQVGYIRMLEAQLAEMRQIEQDLKRLAIVIRDSNDAITLQDLEGHILTWNRGAEKIYGYTEVEALNMNIRQLMPDHKQNEPIDFIEKFNRGEPVESFETQRLTKDGRVLDIWLTVTPIPDEHGAISAIATTERDVTEKNRLIRDLATLSLKDDLTGLYNRRGFSLFAEKLLKHVKRQRGVMMLLYMDLDNLKWINDNLGHRKGDEAIIKFAGILQETFRETDVVARMGGDEFAVMTGFKRHNAAYHTTVERLRKKIDRANHLDGNPPISVSVGLVQECGENINVEQMIQRADQEMYKEKNKKRGERAKHESFLLI